MYIFVGGHVGGLYLLVYTHTFIKICVSSYCAGFTAIFMVYKSTLITIAGCNLEVCVCLWLLCLVEVCSADYGYSPTLQPQYGISTALSR